jgi:hypothetical protein
MDFTTDFFPFVGAGAPCLLRQQHIAANRTPEDGACASGVIFRHQTKQACMRFSGLKPSRPSMQFSGLQPRLTNAAEFFEIR